MIEIGSEIEASVRLASHSRDGNPYRRRRCIVEEIHIHPRHDRDPFVALIGRFWTTNGRWSRTTRVLAPPWKELEE